MKIYDSQHDRQEEALEQLPIGELRRQYDLKSR